MCQDLPDGHGYHGRGADQAGWRQTGDGGDMYFKQISVFEEAAVRVWI